MNGDEMTTSWWSYYDDLMYIRFMFNDQNLIKWPGVYQVDKVSRNRCTYCRWQKCLNSGMNQASVQEMVIILVSYHCHIFVILLSFHCHNVSVIISIVNVHFQEGEKRQQACNDIAQSRSPLSSLSGTSTSSTNSSTTLSSSSNLSGNPEQVIILAIVIMIKSWSWTIVFGLWSWSWS